MILLYMALIAVITGIIIYWRYYYTYSNGYRTGLLQKFSYKGDIFKTYEGEMILDNNSGNPNVALKSEKFWFSVTSKKLAHQLEIMQGQVVTVHYQQKNAVLFWNGDSEYIVGSIKR